MSWVSPKNDDNCKPQTTAKIGNGLLRKQDD